ncbi:hypothetical protein [Nitrospirillum iridis]|uniref:Haloacid dehalogenase-like hydrolase n=1 Tax=Nitrospirillum iridis TaxID=765888 RepID=A0A7X0AY31_9PROT|nr:hypothetical protein [Nitrospirillum iridis]MBB6252262.1 hypothetical protein [Nitrospirillum iridis]
MQGDADMRPGTGPIGLDFDNTIICYDSVLANLGIEYGFLPSGFTEAKIAVRNAVRALEDGERKWQRLQAAAYGQQIDRATPFPGFWDFLALCHERAMPLVVISHKTRYAAADPGGVDLRQAALGWMRHQGLFDNGRSPLTEDQVHFADSRTEKVGMVRRLGCRCFVDDLEEVFNDPDYPRDVPAVLFTGGAPAPAGPWRGVGHWREVADAVIGR